MSFDNEVEFDKSAQQYDSEIDKLGSLFADLIKQKFYENSNSPLLALNSLGVFSNLIKQSGVNSRLQETMKILSQKIENILLNLNESIDNLATYDNPIESMRRCCQCKFRVEQISRGMKLIGLVEDSESISSHIIAKCEQINANIVASWEEKTIQEFGVFEKVIGIDGLVIIEKDGYLSTRLNSSVLRIARDERLIQDLGFEISKQIQDISSKSLRYREFEMCLKKFVTFYNKAKDALPYALQGLIEHKISNLKKMLMNKDLCVYHNSKSTHRDFSNWNVFVEQIQSSIKSIKKDQKDIIGFNLKAFEYTHGIATTNAVHDRSLWIKLWKDWKIFMSKTSKMLSQLQSETWSMFWNNQVYKAIVTCYHIGIIHFPYVLKDLKCRIIIENGTLKYSPDIPQLRQQIYSRFKKFLEFPIQFLSKISADRFDQFSYMANMIIGIIFDIYKNTEESIVQLNLFKKQFASLKNTLNSIDIKKYLPNNCTSSYEFSRNLDSIKARRKQLNSTKEYHKAGIFLISTCDMTRLLNEQLNALYDQFVHELYLTTLDNFNKIREFLDFSIACFHRIPSSPMEFAKTMNTVKDINKEKFEMEKLALSALDKLDVLHTYGLHSFRNGIDDLAQKRVMIDFNNRMSKWQELVTKQRDFSTKLESQRFHIDKSLRGDIEFLNENLNEFSKRWSSLQLETEKQQKDISLMLNSQNIVQLFSDFKRFEKEALQIRNICSILGTKTPDFDLLDDLKNATDNYFYAWNLYKEYNAELEKIFSVKWIDFRSKIYSIAEFASVWNERLNEYEERSNVSYIIEFMRDNIDKLKAFESSLNYFNNEALKEDHWIELLQGKLNLPKDINVDNLMCRHLFDSIDTLIKPETVSYLKDLEARYTILSLLIIEPDLKNDPNFTLSLNFIIIFTVHQRSHEELSIREDFNEFLAWTKVAELETFPHEFENIQTPIISSWKKTLEEINEKSSALASMRESPFFKPFNDLGVIYDKKISYIQDCMFTLQESQGKWLHLEPIFRCDTFPDQSKKFLRLDKDIRKLMKKIDSHPKVFDLSDSNIYPNLLDTLKQHLEELDEHKKTIATFLEEKRFGMPRFYFLGDEGLLEILGHSKSVSKVRPYLKYLFQAVDSLGVDYKDEFHEVSSILSVEGEYVKLHKVIKKKSRCKTIHDKK